MPVVNRQADSSNQKERRLVEACIDSLISYKRTIYTIAVIGVSSAQNCGLHIVVLLSDRFKMQYIT